MPCPTWTTRSPSRSSRKLSITRAEPAAATGDADRRGGTTRRCSAARSAPAPAENRFAASRWGSAGGPAGRPGSLLKISRSRRTSASVWQTTNTSWPAPASSNSSRTRLMSPLKRSTDSIFSRQVVSNEAGGHGRGGHRRELERPPQHVGDGVERMQRRDSELATSSPIPGRA